MERCLRIAFGIVFLVGLLYGYPLSDLGIKNLHKKVSCGDNTTFFTPTNVTPDCFTAALKHIITGLEEASNTCSGEMWPIENTLETVEHMLQQEQNLQHVQTNSSACVWDQEGSRRPFTEFVNNIKTLVQHHNSIKSSTN